MAAKAGSKGPRAGPKASLAILDDITRRVEEIDADYRALSRKVGQLYLQAGDAGLPEITALLDKPMRDASFHQQSFAALLDDLRS